MGVCRACFDAWVAIVMTIRLFQRLICCGAMRHAARPAAAMPRYCLLLVEQLTSLPATDSVRARGPQGSERGTNRCARRLEPGRAIDAARAQKDGRERIDGSARLRPASPQPNVREFHLVSRTESHRPVDGHVRRAYACFIFGHCPRRPLGDPSGSGISRSRV